MMRSRGRLLVVMMAGSLSASAHDLYIMPERFVFNPPAVIVVALHNGDAFPESETSVTPARIRDGQVRWSGGMAPVENWAIDGKRTIEKVRLTARGNLIVSVHTIPNFIEMQPDAAASYFQEEGLLEPIQWRNQRGEATKPSREQYTKFAKALLLAGAPNDIYGQPVGHLIEIVPERNPYTLKPGDTLPVQVLYGGKPAANLQLESAWAGISGKRVQPVGRTDTSGHISVPLKESGKYRLHTIKMERCPNPQTADWESFWASLTFELQ